MKIEAYFKTERERAFVYYEEGLTLGLHDLTRFRDPEFSKIYRRLNVKYDIVA